MKKIMFSLIMALIVPATTVAQSTYDHCVGNDRIHKAAVRGHTNFVRSCLKAGVSPNIREGNYWTPLHSAARGNHLGIVQLLVRYGANVNARDINGNTPLDQTRNYHVIRYLEKQGAVANR